MAVVKHKDGENRLVRIEEDGKEILNIKELRKTVESVKGNPDMQNALLTVVEYIKNSERL